MLATFSCIQRNRILDGSGEEIPETIEDKGGAQHVNTNSIVFPIIASHSTRFKSLEVQLSNTTINELDALYPYRSYLQTLLSFNEGVKDNTLQSILLQKINCLIVTFKNSTNEPREI